MQQGSQMGMSTQFPFNSEVLLEKDLDISVRINSAQQSHPITFSILLPRGSNSNRLKLLFTSKDDLYFLYTLDVNKQKIYELNAEFNLKFERLEDFLEMFRDLVEQIEKGTRNACLRFSNQNTLTLEISTVINGKEFLIISLVAQKENPQVIQQWTALKYGEMKDQIRGYEKKIYQLRQLIRVKNPYLFNYIDKIE